MREASWINEEEEQIIREAWQLDLSILNDEQSLINRLDRCRTAFLNWHSSKKKNGSREIERKLFY